MKKGSFRKVKFEMQQAGYGQYYIIANYKGKEIKAHTTDSEAWDWIDDDSDREKHHDARKHCYCKIVGSWKNQWGY